MSVGELWYVRLSNGDVHHVTVDQLDVAFEAGHIDGDTLVLMDGSSEWKRLGEAAGLDDEEEAPPAQPLWSAAIGRSPAATAFGRAGTGHVPHSRARRALGEPRSRWRPTRVPGYRASPRAPAYAQQAPVSRAPASYAAPAGSIRPVAFDLGDDLDLDVSYKKRGSSKGWVVAAMALALVGGGVGYAATHGVGLAAVGGGSGVAAAAAAPIAPPPVDPIPTPAAAPRRPRPRTAWRRLPSAAPCRPWSPA